MRSSLTALWIVLATSCTAPSRPSETPRAGDRVPEYVTCAGEGVSTCDSASACVEGLCVPRCGEGGCAAGEVCWEERECRDTCDASHACGTGFRCKDDGTCGADPCGAMALFPHSIRSPSLPLLVHYRDPGETESARVALAAAEEAWEFETGRLGFDPPASDAGRCGPDGALDVFVWRTYRGCVSDEVCELPETPHDDRANYLIVDPFGPYGGDHLRATTAHELAHALQAAHDWNEIPIAFEMGAQWVESLFAPDEPTWISYFDDYQQHADWSFDHDDGYESWFMYGSALFLHFLRERVFTGPMQDRFVAEVWRGSRSVAGTNEPDLVDAFEAVLTAHTGISLEESLGRFARARWFVAARHDGHFSFGARMGEASLVPVRDLVSGTPLVVDEGPELLGTHYVRVRGSGIAHITLTGDERVRFRVEAIGSVAPVGSGGTEGVSADGASADGETLSLDARGEIAVPLGAGSERVLALLALPRDAAGWDPDTRPEGRFGYRISQDALTPGSPSDGAASRGAPGRARRSATTAENQAREGE